MLFRSVVKMLAHTPVYPVLFPRPDKKSNQKNCKPKAIIKREVFKAKGCRHTVVCQTRQHRKILFLVGCGGFGYGILCLDKSPVYTQLSSAVYRKKHIRQEHKKLSPILCRMRKSFLYIFCYSNFSMQHPERSLHLQPLENLRYSHRQPSCLRSRILLPHLSP